LNPIPSSFDASGAFETCRVRKGRPLQLEEHLRRLGASLKTAGIFSWDAREVRTRIRAAARGMKEGYVRVAVRRYGTPRILVHSQPALPYDRRLYSQGVSIRTAPGFGVGGDPSWGRIKASERLSSVLARAECSDAFELLRTGRDGTLTEGTISNLFIVSDGQLMTTPGWVGVLHGVTQDRILRSARRLKIPVRTVPLTRHELFNAEEAFLTNVLMGILPVREADGRRIGSNVPGPVTRRLMRSLTEGVG